MRRLKESYCDEFEQIDDNTITIHIDLLRFTPDLNLWDDIGSGKVTVNQQSAEGNVFIEYYADYTRTVIMWFFGCLFIFTIEGMHTSLWGASFYNHLFSAMVVILPVLSGAVSYLRHRSFFLSWMKYPKAHLGKYKWQKIISGMTEAELKTTITGNPFLPEEVAAMAGEELQKRHDIK